MARCQRNRQTGMSQSTGTVTTIWRRRLLYSPRPASAGATYDPLVLGQANQPWWHTTIEAPDPAALAAFYSAFLEWPVVHEVPGTSVVSPPQGSVFLVFQSADGYVAPVWPPESGEQRTMMHLDFHIEDLDVAVANAVALGARVADFQPQDDVRVLFDPAGHPFCLCLDLK